jgi:hypothetical protein
MNRYEEDEIDALGHFVWLLIRFFIAVLAFALLITCME